MTLRICVKTECVLEPARRAGSKTQAWFYEQVYCYRIGEWPTLAVCSHSRRMLSVESLA